MMSSWVIIDGFVKVEKWEVKIATDVMQAEGRV